MPAGNQNQISKLYPAHQKENEQDQQHQPNTAAGTITPFPAVRPSWYHANQQQNQNYQQHCA
jgi:hypothetical protein